ncbi:uncharacterized protein PHALS_00128 [Plasmopara halstedii]|uniref:Uncharacterized protein n=1 Tax=Plasmopara halstedii TaxID=4781 RepID=A0A0P1A5Z3_PLAHL|nr:uncharacterized protein PHALS_00128 [Plasmopara halstedii]CEG35797.1 hypothetical protein PHALS_00128 [Plasmopara halstedii]|eukprot:XP_024572166.1 hypothetical protein PHALS_00128 [Plasmopara halstedii]
MAEEKEMELRCAGILSTEQHTILSRLLTLYLARKEGEYSCQEIVHGGFTTEYEEMSNFTLADDEAIHVLVELLMDKFDVKRQRVEHHMSLAELWEHLDLQLAVLSAPHQLVELLQKSLPFKLMLRDAVAAGGVFNTDGPSLTCPDLALLLDSFLYMYSPPPEAKASGNSWQECYDALLRISNSLCRDRGFGLRGCRNVADKTCTTILRRRPDYILLYKGLVLMRGERKMAKLTTQSYACDLEPFVPDEIEKRKIVLLDDFIEQTIKRTQSGGEMNEERW